MPFEFPYTDFHEINLNKFIKAVKNLLGGHGGELLQKQSNIPFDYAWKPVTGLTSVNSVNGMTGNVTLTATDVGAIPNTTPIPEPANNLPADLGVAYRGTSLKYARMDHVHKMPTASDVGALPVGTTIPLPGLNAPADLGTAYRGTATRYSREDHVHKMPSASDVGALADTTLYAGSKTAGGPADKAVSIPMGSLDASSTSTVMKADVTGITELRNGVLMWLKNGVVSSASGVTLNINNLGAKPIYSSQSASSAITTLFNINYTALMIYNEDRVAGGCWDYVYGYDSNTNTIGYQIRTYAQTLPMQSVTYRYRLLFTSKDHKHFVPANNSTSTNSTTARTPCQDPIDPFGPLYYYGTTSSVSAGTKPSASYLWQQFSPITLGYSFTGYTLTAFEPVFLVCTPNADGSAVINSSNPITQTLPSTADGKIYILLGVATTTTAFEMILDHPVYYYTGSGIAVWTNSGFSTPTTPTIGDFLVYTNNGWDAVALSVWQGGSY